MNIYIERENEKDAVEFFCDCRQTFCPALVRSYKICTSGFYEILIKRKKKETNFQSI